MDKEIVTNVRLSILHMVLVKTQEIDVEAVLKTAKALADFVLGET